MASYRGTESIFADGVLKVSGEVLFMGEWHPYEDILSADADEDFEDRICRLKKLAGDGDVCDLFHPGSPDFSRAFWIAFKGEPYSRMLEDWFDSGPDDSGSSDTDGDEADGEKKEKEGKDKKFVPSDFKLLEMRFPDFRKAVRITEAVELIEIDCEYTDRAGRKRSRSIQHRFAPPVSFEKLHETTGLRNWLDLSLYIRLNQEHSSGSEVYMLLESVFGEGFLEYNEKEILT